MSEERETAVVGTWHCPHGNVVGFRPSHRVSILTDAGTVEAYSCVSCTPMLKRVLEDLGASEGYDPEDLLIELLPSFEPS